MISDEVIDGILSTFGKKVSKYDKGHYKWERARNALAWLTWDAANFLTTSQINKILESTKGKRTNFRHALSSAKNFDETSLKVFGRVGATDSALLDILSNDKISIEAKKKILTKATLRDLSNRKYFLDNLINATTGEIKDQLKSISDIKDIIE